MAKEKIVEEEVEELESSLQEEEEEEEEEEVEEPEGKMTQDEFLESIGLADRPGSLMASTAWAEYQAS